MAGAGARGIWLGGGIAESPAAPCGWARGKPPPARGLLRERLRHPGRAPCRPPAARGGYRRSPLAWGAAELFRGKHGKAGKFIYIIREEKESVSSLRFLALTVAAVAFSSFLQSCSSTPRTVKAAVKPHKDRKPAPDFALKDAD